MRDTPPRLSSRVITTALTLLLLAGAALVASHLSGYAAPSLSGNTVGDSVELSWTSGAFPAGCTQAQNYRVYRQDNGAGAFSQITTVDHPETTFTDTGLANGTYAYRVQARCNVPGPPPDTNNLSLVSNTVNAEVASAPACAGAPTLSASATPISLWPPNGKLVSVTVTGTISPQANCAVPESVTYWIVDEYGELSSSAQVNVAVQDSGFSFTVSLEASRLGQDLDGRDYQIHVSTPDGGYIVGSVVVPHDQRKK